MRRSKVILYAGLVIALAITAVIINFILNSSYRNALPEKPSQSVSNAIAEQVFAAHRQAYINTTAVNIGRLGMAYHSFGNYGKAAECYKLAIKKNGSEWVWNFYLAFTNLEQGELTASIQNFTQVTKKDPANQFALYYLGEAYQKSGLNKEAQNCFSKIISANNSDDGITVERENYFSLKSYAQFQSARIYINTNRPDSAEKISKELLASEPTFGPAYRLLGNVYKLKDDTALSHKYIIRANDYADYSPPASKLIDEISLISRLDQYLFKQIDDAIRSSNDRWALKLCDKAITYYPENKQLISNIFFTSLRLQNKEKALSYLDKHFALYDDNARELMDAMDILYSSGLYDEAYRYFGKAVKLLPKNSTLIVWLFERGKKKEALTLMNVMVKNNPKDQKILADFIRILIDIGDEESAQTYFTQLKLTAPNSQEIGQVKGAFAEAQKNMEAALAAYKEALNAGAKDLIFLKELAKTYVRENQWQQGIGNFRLALRTYPNDPDLLEGLGRLLIACPDTALRDNTEGIEYMERAFFHSRSAYQTKLAAGKSLATVYVSLGDKKNALLFINRTVKLAKEKNLSEEYVNYFKKLVAKK